MEKRKTHYLNLSSIHPRTISSQTIEHSESFSIEFYLWCTSELEYKALKRKLKHQLGQFTMSLFDDFFISIDIPTSVDVGKTFYANICWTFFPEMDISIKKEREFIGELAMLLKDCIGGVDGVGLLLK